MKKAHFITLIIGLALVAFLFVGTSLGVRDKSAADTNSFFAEERPASFSLDVGHRKAAVRGFFESLKASLNVFGIVQKPAENAAALKKLLEETKKQIAADAKKQAQEKEKSKRRRSRRHAEDQATFDYGDRYEAQDSTQDRSQVESAAAFMGPGPAVGSVPSPPGYDSFMEENLPKDVEGWINKIVSERSYRVFTQFVALYKVGTISPEIFYPVVRELLAESDVVLVKYGVLALTGAIETESFATLVEYRGQLPGDPEIYQLVQQGFDSYAQPAHLPHLFAVLRTPDSSEAFFEAVRVAESSIRDWYLRELSGDSEGEAAESSLLVYDQLLRALREGHRRAATEDTRAPLEGLLALMGGGSDEVIAGIDVPY